MRLNFALANPQIQNALKDETAYNSFYALCIETAKGTQKVTKEEANAEILKNIRFAMGLNTDPEHYKNNPAARLEIDHALSKTASREAMFEIIAETVDDQLISGWESDPWFNRMVERKSMALGDTNVFYIEDDVDLMISEVTASNHDLIRQRLGAGRELTVNVRSYGAKVYCEAERYLMGVEDWAKLVGKITEAYNKMIADMIHTAFVSAGQSLPSPTQWNLSIQLNTTTATQFKKLLRDVSIASGTPAVIYGTDLALEGLQNMIPANIFAEDAKRDIYTFGRIGHFNQYDIVEIPQRFKDKNTAAANPYLYDDDKLFILPGNMDRPIKMYDEGGTQIYQVMDRDTHIDHTFDYEVVRKFGLKLLTNVRFGTVTILP